MVDISAGGARIEVTAGVTIPERFKLLIPDDLFEAECEVRHADGMSAGLFTPTISNAHPEIEPLMQGTYHDEN